MRAFAYFLAVLWLAAAVGILYLQYLWQDVFVWEHWEQDGGPWCQRDRVTGLMREPSNSYSDIGFLAISFALLWMSLEDRRQLKAGRAPRNLPQAFPGMTFLFCLANVTHFFGTWGNHACRCHALHAMDVFGMFCLTWWFAAFAFFKVAYLRRWVSSPWVFHLGYLAGCAALYPFSFSYYADPMCETVETVVMVGLVLPMIACTLYARSLMTKAKRAPSFYLMGLAMLQLAIGTVLNKTDQRNIWCDPESMFPGHTIWHFLTTGAVSCFIVYLRGETQLPLDRILGK
eukprot:PLAT5647.1.p1 GENE.PLAT5647.1~~PLAT5647.1.p1  ORF type:complete len:307 (-),score=97.94 PLAT5647.1:68-928(-)